ncbi:MAG: hypothetical protein ABW001_06940 [Mycobacterium sp.]
MSKLTSTILSAAAAALLGLVPLVSAPSASAAEMPMTGQWRACDFSKQKWVEAVGYARPTAHLTNDSGTLKATIDINSALPFTHYDVRVIQTPRASIGCAPGAPGVITGGLQTDGVGAGTVALQGAVASGATGAWVIVQRPAEHSQTPAEFYTTDFVAPI